MGVSGRRCSRWALPSLGKDNTLRLWRSDGAPDAGPMRHGSWIQDALVLPDGRIFSFAWQMIYVWSADGKLLQSAPIDADFLLCHDKTLVAARDARLLVYDLHFDRVQ
jgi:hypothetical protein